MDILGYKDYLKNNPEKTQEYLDTILDAVEKAKKSVFNFENETMPMYQIDGGLRLKIFSDNILLCMPFGEGKDEIRRAIVFLIAVASIQRGLVLQHGLIMRGGITEGELFINEDMVFGQGLIDAVSLESSTEYPCVSVSDQIQKHLFSLLHDVTDQYEKTKQIVRRKMRQEQLSPAEQSFLDDNLENVSMEVYYMRTLNVLLRRFEKETAFLSYLFDLTFEKILGYEFAMFLNNIAAENPNRFPGLLGTLDDIRIILLAHKEIVMSRIKEYCHYDDIDKTDKAAISVRESIIRKYNWLLRYHNNICMECNFKQGLFLYQYGCDQNVLGLIIKIRQ